MGVLGIVASGFMVIAALFLMSQGMGYFAGMGFVYLLLAVVLFFPNLFLIQYSNLLKRFSTDKSPADFELAMAKQKQFWMYVGILSIIYIAIIIIAVLFGVGTGVSRRF